MTNNVYGVLKITDGIATIALRTLQDLSLLDAPTLKDSGAPFIIISIDDLDIHDPKFGDVVKQIGITKIGMVAGANELGPLLHLEPSVLQSENDFSEERLAEILDDTLKEAFSKRIEFIGAEKLAGYQKTIRAHSKTGKTLILTKETTIISACVLSGLKLNGRTTGLISWVWSAEGTSLATKREVLAKTKSFLYQSGFESLFAQVDLPNKRSIGFFEKLGFRARCVVLIP